MGKNKKRKKNTDDARDISEMTPEEQAQLFAEVMGEVMGEMKRKLVTVLEQLDDLNSSYDATKEFLEARGLERVSQLDAQGKQELRRHLEQRLKEVLAESGLKKPRDPNNPSN